jgi:hypothetical protein
MKRDYPSASFVGISPKGGENTSILWDIEIEQRVKADPYHLLADYKPRK